jgi:3',5'-cyclic AMP phosphodiesterase CpdA
VADVVASRAFEKLFAAYMTHDLAPAAGAGERPDYPYVQLRGGVALIGVSSSVATGDSGAWGRVGEDQLARLEAALTAPELAGKTRVVLIHHPPVRQKHGEERNLRDRAALAAALARVGADLVLHGHDHQDERSELPGPGGKPIPIIGGGSASYTGSAEKRSRYNLFEIGGSQITWVTRAHDEAADVFKEVRRERLV